MGALFHLLNTSEDTRHFLTVEDKMYRYAEEKLVEIEALRHDNPLWLAGHAGIRSVWKDAHFRIRTRIFTRWMPAPLSVPAWVVEVNVLYRPENMTITLKRIYGRHAIQ